MGQSPYKKQVKRLVDHKPGCLFADDKQPDQFFVAKGSIYRDSIGRKGSSSWAWDTYVCNDPDCDGKVAVRWDVVGDLIASALAT